MTAQTVGWLRDLAQQRLKCRRVQLTFRGKALEQDSDILAELKGMKDGQTVIARLC